MLREAAGLELTPVGDALCVFRPATGALGLLNAAGRATWEVCQDDALLQLPAKPGPAVQQDFSVPQCFYYPQATDAASTEFYLTSASGRTVHLRVHVRWLGELLAAVVVPLTVAALGQPAAILDVVQRADRFDIWLNGTLLHSSISPAEIRRQVLTEIALTLIGSDRVAAILHACAVDFGSGAVLLAGRSGVGKSTLTAALVSAGGDYLGDDLVPLDRAGRAVHPFPTALSVKSGSWQQVAGWFPALDEQPIHRIRDLAVRYLPLAGSRCAKANCVKTIIFPSFEPRAEFAVHQLAPDQSFALLVDAGSAIAGSPASARPLAELAETTPAWHITYGDLGPSLQAILSIARAP